MSKYKEKMEALFYYDIDQGKYDLATRDDISKIEEIIGFTLPTDYVDFLLDYGGFDSLILCPLKEIYPKDNGEDNHKISVDIFLSAQPNREGRRLISDFHAFRGRMPFNFLPISYSGSDIICLCLSGENQGKVYFWEMDFEEEVNEEEGEEPGYSNVYLVANSFDEFINSLELKYEPEMYQLKSREIPTL
jgi:hypothetical protein